MSFSDFIAKITGLGEFEAQLVAILLVLVFFFLSAAAILLALMNALGSFAEGMKDYLDHMDDKIKGK